jgi:hypothetical protein
MVDFGHRYALCCTKVSRTYGTTSSLKTSMSSTLVELRTLYFMCDKWITEWKQKVDVDGMNCLSRTVYFTGIAEFLSEIYVPHSRRKALLTCAAIICTLKAQLLKRIVWRNSSVVDVFGDVINTFFSRFSNWFEILRMILMDGNPENFMSVC